MRILLQKTKKKLTKGYCPFAARCAWVFSPVNLVLSLVDIIAKIKNFSLKKSCLPYGKEKLQKTSRAGYRLSVAQG